MILSSPSTKPMIVCARRATSQTLWTLRLSSGVSKQCHVIMSAWDTVGLTVDLEMARTAGGTMCRCRKGYFHQYEKDISVSSRARTSLHGRELAMHHLAVGVRTPLGTSGSQRLAITPNPKSTILRMLGMQLNDDAIVCNGGYARKKKKKKGFCHVCLLPHNT